MLLRKMQKIKPNIKKISFHSQNTHIWKPLNFLKHNDIFLTYREESKMTCMEPLPDKLHIL